jgi:phenylpropionate dioxygenase-like ring-hydroxylating dioxygenase large terminal subunit
MNIAASVGRTSAQIPFHDDAEQGVFRFSPKVYSDPELFEREKRRLFDRAWLYAGHETEVPNPGDFITRKVGGRPLIIARGSDGQIRVFHNSCRHRGAMVCRDPKGNAKTFLCFYHFWSYDNQGRLDGVPGKEAYGPGFKFEDMSLYQARMDSYRGWMFVCFSRETEPLKDYLGEVCSYFDLIFDQDDGGSAILPGTHEYAMRANWKLLMENTVDIYHLNATHGRFMRDYVPKVLGLKPPDPRTAHEGSLAPRALGNGHAVIEYRKFSGSADEAKRPEWEARFGKERATRMIDFTRSLILFPNTLFIEQRRVIRTVYPLAPDHAEITAWPLMPVNDPPAVRKQRLDIYLSFLGPAGHATPDDVEVMELIQKNCATLPEEALIDCSRGALSNHPRPDDELQMRTFWRQWRDLILDQRI